MAIRLTPGQLRNALGLTKETFRYWKRDLPALAVAVGHGPCFEAGELLATAVAKHITDKAGIPVSRLAPFASELFALCRRSSWPQLARMTAIIFFESNEVQFVSADAFIPIKETTLVVPLQSLIEQLRGQLLDTDAIDQPKIAPPRVAIPAKALR
jgi:hypothetical protein